MGTKGAWSGNTGWERLLSGMQFEDTGGLGNRILQPGAQVEF